jgi:hypothetical protein
LSATAPVFQVPAAVLDGVVGYIEVSSALTKRALDEVGVHRSTQEKAAALRPALLNHMVANKVCTAEQKQAADAMLGAHDTTLQLLKAAVDKIAELNAYVAQLKGGTKAAGDLGQGVDDGQAAGQPGEYNSLTSPMVGEKTANVKESDKALLRLIGRA